MAVWSGGMVGSAEGSAELSGAGVTDSLGREEGVVPASLPSRKGLTMDTTMHTAVTIRASDSRVVTTRAGVGGVE